MREPDSLAGGRPETPIPLHGLGAATEDSLPVEIHPLERMPPAARAGYPHRHDFYQVLYLTEGRGVHVVDFVPLPLDPPCLYFVSPGQVHFWELERPVSGKVILFSHEVFVLWPGGDRLLQELAFFHAVEGPPSLHLAGADRGEFAALMRHLEDEHRHARFGRSSVLSAYLHVLLVEAQRRYQGGEVPVSRNRSAQVVRRFKKMLSERFLVDRQVARYAEAMGITAGHLSDTVKAVTGHTAGQLIRREVVLEAKRLLAHSELTVAEIAYGLNFGDPSYFGRFFRREAGQSPGAFRRDFREKHQGSRHPAL